jgi:cold-inducible RNA-binding protein
MGRKLYVGNLAYGVDSSALEQMFAPFGTVQSAQVIADRDTGRSKGFGFVEMGSDQEAQAAIAAMSGKEVDGRPLTVNEAVAAGAAATAEEEAGAATGVAAVGATNTLAR